MEVCKCPKTCQEVVGVLLWLLLSGKETDSSDHEITSKVIEFTSVPNYIPGYNLVYIPAAGRIFGLFDVGFVAVSVYFIGAILYLADSIYICYLSFDPTAIDDMTNPVVFLNTWAAIVFVLNALLCFIDWWLQIKQVAAMNMYIDTSIPNKVFFTRIPSYLSACYFYNNVFFMSAALVYVIQGLYPGAVSKYPGDYFINFWGSLLYLCSGTCSLLEFRENIRQRHLWNMPRLRLFTLTWREVDWFGWGDVLYASLSLFLFVAVFIDTSLEVGNNLYLVENIMFLLNSMAYFIGYIVYMNNLRDDMFRCIGGGGSSGGENSNFNTKGKFSPTPSVTSGSNMSSPRDIESASVIELSAIQDRDVRKKSFGSGSKKNRKSPSHVVGDNSYKHNTSNSLFQLVSDVDTVADSCGGDSEHGGTFNPLSSGVGRSNRSRSGSRGSEGEESNASGMSGSGKVRSSSGKTITEAAAAAAALGKSVITSLSRSRKGSNSSPSGGGGGGGAGNVSRNRNNSGHGAATNGLSHGGSGKKGGYQKVVGQEEPEEGDFELPQESVHRD